MFIVGLDLGQRHDHSAIVVVEKPPRHRLSTMPQSLVVRMAQRIPLGMAYPEVVEVVRHVTGMANAAGRVPGEGSCKLVVDATGLGRPVVELLRRARLDCLMTAVTITSGDRQHSRKGEGEAMNVPKQDLIAGVQMALERRELRIAKQMRESGTLKRELLDVRMSRRESGYVRVGADGYGQHDDLVIALALAVGRAGRF
jgi:hypothetical protein